MVQTEYTTDGLIIREQNIGDNDKLVTVLTRDMGVISAYAAGSKSIKSKKGSSTCLLSYSSFVLKKKENISVFRNHLLSKCFLVRETISRPFT